MPLLEISRRTITSSRALPPLLVLLLMAAPALMVEPCAIAQTAMATMSGRVTDQSNAVVSDADIRIENVDTHIVTTAKANGEGLYVFPSLQPGNYEMTVSKSGFRSTTVRELKLEVQASVSRNVMLQVGSAIEIVTVNADPASMMLQGTSSELGTVIGEKEIEDLPLNGRNFTELLQLIPGVNPVSTAQSSGVGVNDLAVLAVPSATYVQPSFGGQFNRSNLTMLDGSIDTELNTSSVIISPIVDAIQEFKAQSHEDKAEYGGVLGGVVDVVSKSGANQFHAGAWELVRNNDFDARDSFADEAGGVALPPAPYHQNMFGVLASGPVWIPKVYNGHNRTFFLFAYEGWRYDTGNYSKFWVPTSAELGGDFSHSHLSNPIYDPATTTPDPANPGQFLRTAFPGNIINPGRIDATAINFIKAYFNAPNLQNDPLGNELVTKASTNNGDHYTARLDEHLGDKDSFFGRYDHLMVSQLSPYSQTQSSSNSVPAANFAVGWTHLFSANLLIDNRYGQTRRPFTRATTDSAGLGPMTGLGFVSPGGTQLSLSGPWGSGGINLANTIVSPAKDLSDNLTWIRGQHNFKFGLQYINQGNTSGSPAYGGYGFGNDITDDPENPGNTGLSLASAFLGLPDTANNTSSFVNSNNFSTWAGFGQDAWNISKNVTVTYGFRFDHRRPFSPNATSYASGPNIDGTYWIGADVMPPACGATGPTPCIPGGIASVPDNNLIKLSPYGRAFNAAQFTDFGPRLGGAWRPNTRMVVRGGYGITYDALMGIEQDWKGIVGGWPSVGSVNSTLTVNQLGQPLSPIEDNFAVLGAALPAATPWGVQNWYFDPHHRDSRSQQWNLEIEREMTKSLVVTIGYVGSHSDRLDVTGLWDTAQTPGAGTPAQVTARKPFPVYSQISWYGTDRGFSHYNSFQAKVNNHLSNGLQYLVSYTWSKTTDAGGSGWFDAENGAANGLQNYYDLNGSRGLSALDATQDLSISGLYELPFGVGKTYLNHGPASWVLGNWETTMTLQLRSGVPFGTSINGDVANIGVPGGGYARPNLTGNAKLAHGTKDEWFNVNAFTIPVLSYGNAPRDFLFGPHYALSNFSLLKNFHLAENGTLQFRAEAFNVFNIQNYGTPDGNLSDLGTTFGQINNLAGPPRQLQLGLHLQY